MRMTIPAARTNHSYANAAAITAISPNDRQDGDDAFNADTGVGYHFDASAVAGGLTPDLGTGRWIADATVAGAVAATDLASTANALGASLVGVEDSATQLTATTVEAALAELAAKFAAGLTPAIAKLQIATGTLVAGEATINTNIVVTANSYVLAMPTANVTGSTNFACLSNTRASNVVGAAGVGSVLIRALGNDGAKDADAAGAFVAFIIN
jgi:hypothetical protein